MVEKASRRFRLSWVRAMSEEMMTVNGGDPPDDDGDVEGLEEVDAEDSGEDAEDAEDTDFDDGDRVEQGGDRGGGDHGTREPGVEGHDAGFGEAEDRTAGGGAGPRPPSTFPARKPPVKVHVTAGLAGRQKISGGKGEGDRGTEQVGQVGASAGAGLAVLVVGDERVGREREHLVEEIEREQVAGEGDAEGGAEGDGEEGVEARLGVLLQAAHVADRIERR